MVVFESEITQTQVKVKKCKASYSGSESVLQLRQDLNFAEMKAATLIVHSQRVHP